MLVVGVDKSAIQIFAAALLLAAATFAVEWATVAGTLYPQQVEGNFGTFVLPWVFMILCVLSISVLAFIRFLQTKFVLGIALRATFSIPFAMPRTTDFARMRFEVNRRTYLQAVERDQSPSPKYLVFDWGNRNTGFGGGAIVEALVYDESGEVARAAGSRSPAWRGHSMGPEHRWIVEHRGCRTYTDRLAAHFYHVIQVCD
jgi:hypothetical protein